MEYLLCSITDKNSEGSSVGEFSMKVITPRNPTARGAQLSLMFKNNVNDFFVELQKRGVIVSLRVIWAQNRAKKVPFLTVMSKSEMPGTTLVVPSGYVHRDKSHRISARRYAPHS